MFRGIRHTAALGGILCWIGAATAAGQEEALAAVPSGLTLALMDKRIEAQPDGSDWARFRFVAPALAEGVLGTTWLRAILPTSAMRSPCRICRIAAALWRRW